MRKRILVLDANPKSDSFINYLSEAYVGVAQKHHDVRLVRLSEMDFEIDLSSGYDETMQMEETLLAFQASLKWCDHLVIMTPVWWGAVPAKLKGLIDRTLLPGFAFRYEKGMVRPKQLLQGKTARIVMTMDTPPWYYLLFQGAPALRQLKSATLKFVGFRSVKSNMIGPVITSTASSRSKWAEYVSRLGATGQ